MTTPTLSNRDDDDRQGSSTALQPIAADTSRAKRRDLLRGAHARLENGTAPVEFASGGRVVHRVSLRGSRKLNHAIHMAAISQIRQTSSNGRLYFDRKVAEGKTKKEAVRSLKRRISNTVYRQLLFDAR